MLSSLCDIAAHPRQGRALPLAELAPHAVLRIAKLSSTSAVCSPSRGAGRRKAPGVSDSFAGIPSVLMVPAAGCCAVDNHLPRNHLRIGHRLVEGQHGTRRYSRRRQRLQPVRRRLLPKALLQQFHQGVIVAHPVAVLLKTRILRQLWRAEQLAEPQPKILLCRADCDPAVGCPKHLVG